MLLKNKNKFVNILLIILLTALFLLVTNSFWLVRKPITVEFDMFGKGVKNVEFSIGQKSKHFTIDLDKRNNINFRLDKKYSAKNIKIKINSKDTCFSDIELGIIDLRNGKIELNEFDKYEVQGAKKQVFKNKILLKPTSNEITLSYPVTIRPSMKFSVLIFILFLALPLVGLFCWKKFDIQIKDFLQKVKSNINANKKALAFGLFFAVVFTIFTPHWWIKRDFWENYYVFPIVSDITLEYEETNFDENANQGLESLKSIKSVSGGIRDDIVRVKRDGDFHKVTLKTKTVTLRKNKNIKNDIYMKFNRDLELTIKYPKLSSVKSLKINNIENLQNIIDSEAKVKVKSGENLHICSTVGLANSLKFKMSENINSYCLIITFLLYFLLFANIYMKLIQKGFWAKFSEFFKKYSFEIGIYFIFFTIFMLSNHSAIYNTDYFLDNNLFYFEDISTRVTSILWLVLSRFHSYFFLPFYPFFDIGMFTTKNLTLTLMLIYSSLSALSVVFLFRTLCLIKIPKQMNVLLLFVFGFSYTIMTCYFTFEVYPITNFYLSMFVYLLVKTYNSKEVNYKNIFFMSLILALTFGVTTPNIFTLIFLIIPYFLLKRNLKGLAFFAVISLILVLWLSNIQSGLAEENSLKVSSIFNKINLVVYWTASDKSYGFAQQTLRMPVLAQDKLYAKNVMNSFWVVFASLILVSFICLFKYSLKREDKYLFCSLLIALAFNFATTYFWDQFEGFLFAPNHFVLWVVIFAYCLKILDETILMNKKWVNKYFVPTLLVLFLLVEIPTNYTANKKVQYDVMEKYPLTSTIYEVNE